MGFNLKIAFFILEKVCLMVLIFAGKPFHMPGWDMRYTCILYPIQMVAQLMYYAHFACRISHLPNVPAQSILIKYTLYSLNSHVCSKRVCYGCSTIQHRYRQGLNYAYFLNHAMPLTPRKSGIFCCCIQVNLDMTDHCTTDFFHMTDDMLGPSPMHIKYSSYVYDGFCI